MAKAILLGTLKKVEGKKGGIAVACAGMTLESGSIKELFGLAQKESIVRLMIEPVQQELFDTTPGPNDSDDADE